MGLMLLRLWPLISERRRKVGATEIPLLNGVLALSSDIKFRKSAPRSPAATHSGFACLRP